MSHDDERGLVRTGPRFVVGGMSGHLAPPSYPRKLKVGQWLFFARIEERLICQVYEGNIGASIRLGNIKDIPPDLGEDDRPSLITFAQMCAEAFGGNFARIDDSQGVRRYLIVDASGGTEERHVDLFDMPEEGEEFELTVDFAAVSWRSVVHFTGQPSGGWRYTGELPSGRRTRRCCWVRLEPDLNLSGTWCQIDGSKTYQLIEGHYALALAANYRFDGRWRGILDKGWVNPRSQRVFPILTGDREVAFESEEISDDPSRLWLVGVK